MMFYLIFSILYLSATVHGSGPTEYDTFCDVGVSCSSQPLTGTAAAEEKFLISKVACTTASVPTDVLVESAPMASGVLSFTLPTTAVDLSYICMCTGTCTLTTGAITETEVRAYNALIGGIIPKLATPPTLSDGAHCSRGADCTIPLVANTALVTGQDMVLFGSKACNLLTPTDTTIIVTYDSPLVIPEAKLNDYTEYGFMIGCYCHSHADNTCPSTITDQQSIHRFTGETLEFGGANFILYTPIPYGYEMTCAAGGACMFGDIKGTASDEYVRVFAATAPDTPCTGTEAGSAPIKVTGASFDLSTITAPGVYDVCFCFAADCATKPSSDFALKIGTLKMSPKAMVAELKCHRGSKTSCDVTLPEEFSLHNAGDKAFLSAKKCGEQGEEETIIESAEITSSVEKQVFSFTIPVETEMKSHYVCACFIALDTECDLSDKSAANLNKFTSSLGTVLVQANESSAFSLAVPVLMLLSVLFIQA
eukprot:GHVL01006856.1.p1 GENE.GHVL01006856.1~~GHVL01006856.1.p1  ORF type:complete len:480 (+),score=52.10 GHVL01006856.1:56-1495(+)